MSYIIYDVYNWLLRMFKVHPFIPCISINTSFLLLNSIHYMDIPHFVCLFIIDIWFFFHL